MNFLAAFDYQPLLWFVMLFYAALPVGIVVYMIARSLAGSPHIALKRCA
jgi:hypothetical protein